MKPTHFRVTEYSAELQEAVCSLWSSVFGYRQKRNDPQRVLREKLAWDGDTRGVLVALSPSPSDSASVPLLLGTLMVGYDGHRGWLYRLAVGVDARNRGIGSALVSAGEQRLRSWGCRKINLQTLEHNTQADAFWKRLGYQQEPRNDYGKDFSERTFV